MNTAAWRALVLLLLPFCLAAEQDQSGEVTWEGGLRAAQELREAIRANPKRAIAASPLGLPDSPVRFAVVGHSSGKPPKNIRLLHRILLGIFDAPSREVRFSWEPSRDHPHPRPQGVLHLYDALRPRTDPLILMLPMTGDPDNIVSKFFCSYFYRHGFRCAFLERKLPSEGNLPQELGKLIGLPGLPPYSTVTARQGLKALEGLGVLASGERIGVAGLSMGGIDAPLLDVAEERVAAVALLLSGADIPKILSRIHGNSVEAFERKRTEQMKARGWTLEEFEARMAEMTWIGDPLTYLESLPKSGSDTLYLMINAEGDPAIQKASSDVLRRAIEHATGIGPEARMLPMGPVPERARHVAALAWLPYAAPKMLKHFQDVLK